MPENEASSCGELVDAIRVCSSIHNVRVRPETPFYMSLTCLF